MTKFKEKFPYPAEMESRLTLTVVSEGRPMSNYMAVGLPSTAYIVMGHKSLKHKS